MTPAKLLLRWLLFCHPIHRASSAVQIVPPNPNRMRKNTTDPQASMIREGMRGEDHQQNHVFSYLSPEMRVRPDHPLRIIRAMVDEVLSRLSRRFDSMYAKVG